MKWVLTYGRYYDVIENVIRTVYRDAQDQVLPNAKLALAEAIDQWYIGMTANETERS